MLLRWHKPSLMDMALTNYSKNVPSHMCDSEQLEETDTMSPCRANWEVHIIYRAADKLEEYLVH